MVDMANHSSLLEFRKDSFATTKKAGQMARPSSRVSQIQQIGKAHPPPKPMTAEPTPPNLYRRERNRRNQPCLWTVEQSWGWAVQPTHEQAIATRLADDATLNGLRLRLTNKALMRLSIDAKGSNYALFTFATLCLKPGKQIEVYRHGNGRLPLWHSPGSSGKKRLV